MKNEVASAVPAVRKTIEDRMVEAVDAQVVGTNLVNGNLPIHERPVDDTNPVVKFAREHASAVRKAADALLEKAKKAHADALALAQDIEDSGPKAADFLNTEISAIDSASKQTQEAHTQYKSATKHWERMQRQPQH